MTADLSPVLLIIVTGLIGLVLIPLGLPGLWVILLGILGYGWLTDFQTLSAVFIGVMLGLAILAEVFEAWVGFRFAQRYGGSSRAGWGALVGGLVGAFVGAAVFEYTRVRRLEGSAKAGWGAVLGRAAAAAGKMAVGIVMVVGALFLALRG